MVGVANAQWVVLFDDTQGSSGRLRIAFSDTLNISPGFGSASQGVVPEQNCLCTFGLSNFNLVYASEAAAKAGARALRTTLRGASVHLKYESGTDAEYYPNGALRSMEFEQQGVSVDYSMTFETQDVTNTVPTT